MQEIRSSSAVRASSSFAATSVTANRDALFTEFTPLIRRLIGRYANDAETRHDLYGETYCRFCALLDAFDPALGVPLRPYLARQLHATVYTLARRTWRCQGREVSLQAQMDGSHPHLSHDPTSDWTHRLAQQQTDATIRMVMNTLPRRQSQVVIWRYVEGRSFEEIAKRLSIQTATARSLLRHGLNSLRRNLPTGISTFS